MNTKKPFSTVSYNTKDFLQSKLDALVQKKHISFYAFVEHFPEEDEKRKHKNLFIIPNGQVNKDQITDLLQEMDLSNPLKPLGVMSWSKARFDDWYLYSCHDDVYLMSIGQSSRQYHYQESDFISSDEDYFHELIHTIDMSKYLNKISRFLSKG